MTSAEIRQKFLDYFAGLGHEVVSSSSLVPSNDPTLLFTNAGMVQFKDVFLGDESRQYIRATSSQRCVRAGGKHNDLENVGYTARHHTFFEMLGNFSFGDYFKREAIQFAWTFLTEDLGLSKDRLWVTVFTDDDEAAAIWVDEIGVDPARLTRLGEKDNFWAMGDTGPCGPCSEIFFDHGEEVAGGPPGTADEDGDRFVEIWNLVFMQFDRQSDGTLNPLPKPSVDTGMGMERVAAIMQGVHSNYDIDLFKALIKSASQATGIADLQNPSLRVIADHIRSCSFLIVDGVLPSNEGRGYVLRRIVRRAVRHGYQLGVKDIFFFKLVNTLVEVMGQAYPELKEKQAIVENVLKEEERQFARTLEHGMGILEQAIEKLDGTTIPGKTVFKLYDTFGFPVDLTADVAREQGLTLDVEGFEQAMNQQKELARAASGFTADEKLEISLSRPTEFTGYENLQDDATIEAIYVDGKAVEQLDGPATASLLLSASPFYGESGGQIGDRGELHNDHAKFEVADTQKQNEYLIHSGKLTAGSLKVGDSVNASVNEDERKAITLNHSSTHLMHAALRSVLGEHVTQKGSLVTAEKLRFDFSHTTALQAEEIRKIEKLVNQEIQQNSPVEKAVMTMEQAKQKGALALFGEKYGDEVRVVSMGGKFSTELCGGTHVQRTGDIGVFKIVSETGIAAGIRRIEAVTGNGVINLIAEQENLLNQIGSIVKAGQDTLVEKVKQLSHHSRAAEKQLEQLKAKMASNTGSDLASQAVQVKGINLLTARLDNFNSKALRDTVDQLKNKLGDSSVIVLASVDNERVSLVAGVSKDIMGKIKAGELVNMIASQVGGKGGGRPDMAMAGGSDPGGLPAAMDSVESWVTDRL